MKFLLRIYAVFTVAVKRILAQKWLAIATALGLVVSVALVLSIPIYAEGVYQRILQDKMTGEPSLGLRPYPPFALMFRFIGGSFQSLPWEKVVPADQYFSDTAVKLFGLPEKFLVRHFKTDNYHLIPERDADK